MGAPDSACIVEKGDGGEHTPWWRRSCVLGMLCLVALLVVVIILMAALLPGFATLTMIETRGTDPPCTQNSTQKPDEPEFTLANGRPIVRRSEWSASPPDYRRPLLHPTPYVVIGHTAGPACSDKAHCFSLLRVYRDEHRERWGQPDIAYNFLIDVSGNVYEGRGWDATNNYRSWALRCNLAVTLLGDFMVNNVTTEMMHSLRQLLDLGVVLGKVDHEYRLVAQNQLMETLSPGMNALRAIDTWPHRCLDHCDEGVQCGAEDTVKPDS